MLKPTSGPQFNMRVNARDQEVLNTLRAFYGRSTAQVLRLLAYEEARRIEDRQRQQQETTTTQQTTN